MLLTIFRRSRPVSRVVRGALYDLPAPANIGYFWTFGSALGLFYTVQLVRGLSLRFFYASSGAFDVSLYLARDVNMGWLIRSIHANGASIFLGLAYMHIARGLYFSSFARLPLVWLRGRVLLVLIIAAAFLGYVLPWGQIRYWGATVITNLLGVIPGIGPSLVEILWGGFTVGQPTLTRFYSLHYIVPLAMAPLVLGHLELLHGGGSTSPLGGLSAASLPFHPYSSTMDLVTLWAVLGVFAVIVLGFPHALGRPDNFELANPLKTPVHIMPEWYFLPFYTILRSVPQKTGGVLAMALAIVVMFLLPRIRARAGPWLTWGFFLNFVVLGWLGACPMEAPFPMLGAINSLLYFGVLGVFWALVLPILFRFFGCYSSAAPIMVPALSAFALVGGGGTPPEILRFLTLFIFWGSWGAPHLLYWGLSATLLVAFAAPNALVFFVGFEASLVPISLLILWGGLRPERRLAVAYMAFFTLVGGGVHALGLLANYQTVGRISWLICEPFIFAGRTWAWYALLLALLVKIPAYGVHFWLPKAHVEAPTGGRMVLAGVMLKLGTYGIIVHGKVALVRGGHLLSSGLLWGAMLARVAMLIQPDLKRLAAYRSVVHISLATSALLSWGPLGAQAAFMVALGHGFASSALFCWVGAVQQRCLSRNPAVATGMRRMGPGLFFVSFLIFFANNGTPPFFSFWGEMAVLVSLLMRLGPTAGLLCLGACVACPAVYFLAYFRRVRGRIRVRPLVVRRRTIWALAAHVILLGGFFFVGGSLRLGG